MIRKFESYDVGGREVQRRIAPDHQLAWGNRSHDTDLAGAVCQIDRGRVGFAVGSHHPRRAGREQK